MGLFYAKIQLAGNYFICGGVVDMEEMKTSVEIRQKIAFLERIKVQLEEARKPGTDLENLTLTNHQYSSCCEKLKILRWVLGEE